MAVFVIETDIAEYSLKLALFSAVGVLMKQNGFPDLIHQPSWCWNKSFVHIASFWYASSNPIEAEKKIA